MAEEYEAPAHNSANFNFEEGGYTPPTATAANFSFAPTNVPFNIIGGTSNYFAAIWADSDASQTNGRLFVASPGALSVLDLSLKELTDYYDQSHAGLYDESLDSDDIKDINVVRTQ